MIPPNTYQNSYSHMLPTHISWWHPILWLYDPRNLILLHLPSSDMPLNIHYPTYIIYAYIMSTQRIKLPCLTIIVFPYLDLLIISCCYDKWLSVMECTPIQLILMCIHYWYECHLSTRQHIVPALLGISLLQYPIWPQPSTLIQWTRHYQLLSGVECTLHYVVGMSSQYCYSLSWLVVPHSSSLIIRPTQHPWHCGVEWHTSNIVQVSLQNELTSLISKHSHCEIITSTAKQTQIRVELHGSNRTLVILVHCYALLQSVIH